MVSSYKKYPEYKDSGVEWLGDIPVHWDTNKLRYLFLFGKGLTITKDNLKDDGIPCVNYGEVHSKYGFEVDPDIHSLKCVSEQYLKYSQNSLLSKGDLIFADTSEDIEGSGNFTQLISEKQIFAGYHTIIARPLDRECTRFYAYLLDSTELRTQIRLRVKGVKVFSITQAILRGLNIWLPTMKERETISNFLDYETSKVDTLIEKQQKLIKLLKEKKQAVINHAVTKGLNPNAPMKDSGIEWLGEVPEHWEVLQVRRVIDKIEQGSSPSLIDEINEINKAKVLKISSVKNGNFIEWEAKNIDITHYEERFQINKTDLLMTRGNTLELVADVCFVEKQPEEKLMLSDLIYRLRTNNKVLKKYLSYWFLSTYARIQIKNDARGSSMTMAKVSQSHIKNWFMVLPPFKEQQGIIEYINEQEIRLKRITEKSKEQVSLLKEHRTSLISAAVTGKIDVRDWKRPE